MFVRIRHLEDLLLCILDIYSNTIAERPFMKQMYDFVENGGPQGFTLTVSIACFQLMRGSFPVFVRLGGGDQYCPRQGGVLM